MAQSKTAAEVIDQHAPKWENARALYDAGLLYPKDTFECEGDGPCIIRKISYWGVITYEVLATGKQFDLHMHPRDEFEQDDWDYVQLPLG